MKKFIFVLTLLFSTTFSNAFAANLSSKEQRSLVEYLKAQTGSEIKDLEVSSATSHNILSGLISPLVYVAKLMAKDDYKVSYGSRLKFKAIKGDTELRLSCFIHEGKNSNDLVIESCIIKSDDKFNSYKLKEVLNTYNEPTYQFSRSTLDDIGSVLNSKVVYDDSRKAKNTTSKDLTAVTTSSEVKQK